MSKESLDRGKPTAYLIPHQHCPCVNCGMMIVWSNNGYKYGNYCLGCGWDIPSVMRVKERLMKVIHHPKAFCGLRFDHDQQIGPSYIEY